MSWERVSIKEITVNLDNKRKPLNESERNKISKKQLYPYFGANNIMGYVDEYLFDEEIICIAEDGGSWGDNQKCCVFVSEKCWVNNHAHVLKSNGKADLKYLMYYLNVTNLNSFITGSTRGKLTKSSLDSIKIPLPPLATQKRIADILDAADALRRKDQELLKKYDELAQAIFIDMFGDPVKNEKEWEKMPVINYCDCIVPGRDKPKSFTGNIPWVTTEDLMHLSKTSHSKKKIGLSKNEIEFVSAKIIPKNSVIMTCVGDLGVVTTNTQEIVINQQLHAFQCKTKINPTFLMYNLSHQKEYMYKMSSSTTVPYMNKTVCNSIPTICPPINLQNLFNERINLILEQKNKIGNVKSVELFETLIQKAFKGELVA